MASVGRFGNYSRLVLKSAVDSKCFNTTRKDKNLILGTGLEASWGQSCWKSAFELSVRYDWLALLQGKNNVVAEYALRTISQPIGVSECQFSKAVPENLKS